MNKQTGRQSHRQTEFYNIRLVEIKAIFGRDLKRIHQRHLILIRFRRYCFVVLCIADGTSPSLLRPFPRMSSDFSLFSYKLSIREKGYFLFRKREYNVLSNAVLYDFGIMWFTNDLILTTNDLWCSCIYLLFIIILSMWLHN